MMEPFHNADRLMEEGKVDLLMEERRLLKNTEPTAHDTPSHGLQLTAVPIPLRQTESFVRLGRRVNEFFQRHQQPEVESRGSTTIATIRFYH